MRTRDQIQADAQRLGLELAQTRHDFIRKEREIVAKLDALDAEIVKVRAEEAKQAPAALLARIESIEATMAANDKEKA